MDDTKKGAWSEMPPEVWMQVLHKVPPLWRPVAARVCLQWNNLIVLLAQQTLPCIPLDAPQHGFPAPGVTCGMPDTRRGSFVHRNALWLRTKLLVEASAMSNDAGLRVVRWLLAAPSDQSESKCAAARPCPWSTEAYRRAARAGNLDVMAHLTAYASARDDAAAIVGAAAGGHLTVLGWLRRRHALRHVPNSGNNNTTDGGRDGGVARGRARLSASDPARGLCTLADTYPLWSHAAHRAAVQSGNISVIQWLDIEGCPRTSEGFVDAVETRDLTVLSWLASTSHRAPTHSATSGILLAPSAAHTDNEGRHQEADTHTRETWVAPPMRAAVRAAAQGWIDGLYCLYVAGCNMTSSDLITAAAGQGHIETIRWLRTRVVPGCSWNAEAVCAAIRGGHMHTLAWLVRQKSGLGPLALVEAAARGHVDLLAWLRCHEPDSEANGECTVGADVPHNALPELASPCPWPKSGALYHAAAVGDHVHVLEWLRKHRGMPSLESARCALDGAIGAGAIHAAGWLLDTVPHLVPQAESLWMSIGEGQARVTAWALENGIRLNSTPCTLAAGCDHVGLLAWLRAQSPPCPWEHFDDDPTGPAIPPARFVRRRPDDDAVQAPDSPRSYGRESSRANMRSGARALASGCYGSNGADRGEDGRGARHLLIDTDIVSDLFGACTQAAANGALDALDWLVGAGCWHDPQRLMEAAAARGHLHVIKWGRVAHGWPWHADVTAAAAKGGQSIHIVFALRDSGCPWDERVAAAYASRNDATALYASSVYARPHDPAPWDASVVSAALRHSHVALATALVSAGCPSTLG